MRVIPTVTWGTPSSLDFCFDGIECGSVVAVSTYAKGNNERGFMVGYNKMLEVLNPSAIICYGDPFPSMTGNIKVINPYNHEKLIKKLGFDEIGRAHV